MSKLLTILNNLSFVSFFITLTSYHHYIVSPLTSYHHYIASPLTSYHHYTAFLSMADKLSCLGVLENEKPGDALSSLDVCNSTCFPNIRMLLTILPRCPCRQQLPNRSFSVLKLLKSNLRSRKGEKRLSALTLAYIYSDSFDYRSIAAAVTEDIFLMTRKTCCTTATTADIMCHTMTQQLSLSVTLNNSIVYCTTR